MPGMLSCALPAIDLYVGLRFAFLRVYDFRGVFARAERSPKSLVPRQAVPLGSILDARLLSLPCLVFYETAFTALLGFLRDCFHCLAWFFYELLPLPCLVYVAILFVSLLDNQKEA
jgi:hypothetical protein